MLLELQTTIMENRSFLPDTISAVLQAFLFRTQRIRQHDLQRDKWWDIVSMHSILSCRFPLLSSHTQRNTQPLTCTSNTVRFTDELPITGLFRVVNLSWVMVKSVRERWRRWAINDTHPFACIGGEKLVLKSSRVGMLGVVLCFKLPCSSIVEGPECVCEGGARV